MAKSLPKNDSLWYDWVMKPKRVVLYARVSTKDKKQDTRNQLAQLRNFCASQDWTIAREYIDHASAKTGDRPQFKALMDAASRREFDLVLFWSLDRFSREGVLETLQCLRTLTSYGVGWKSFTEQLLFANNGSAYKLLGSNAFITVVESAELWNGNDLSVAQRLSRKRTLFAEAQMGPRIMVVAEIIRQRSLEMARIQNDVVVQTLPSNGAD